LLESNDSRRTRKRAFTGASVLVGKLALASLSQKVILSGRRYGVTATMNISLPDDLKAFVKDQATKWGFGSVSQYMSAIIREQLQQEGEREKLDALLLDGLDSGPGTPMTRKDWEHISREGKKRITERKRG
jgi:antitoxin ParD1/3/4